MLEFEFLFLIYYTIACNAIRQEIIFYTGLNCTGEGLILESKQSSLVPEAPRIISSYKSTLTVGVWMLYSGTDFTHYAYNSHWTGGYEIQKCFHYKPISFEAKSARYLGPPDTRTNSLSLYEDIVFGGREVTITGPAFTNLSFVPKSIWTTGKMPWTLYSGENFDGIATCFIPEDDWWFDYILNLNYTMINVRSIVKGCDRPIDHFIYGGNIKKDMTEHYKFQH